MNTSQINLVINLRFIFVLGIKNKQKRERKSGFHETSNIEVPRRLAATS